MKKRKNACYFSVLSLTCLTALLLCLLPSCGDVTATVRGISSIARPEQRQIQSRIQRQVVPQSTTNPPTIPILNAVVDNPLIGDEREFVRVFDMNGTEYIDEITLEPNQVYIVRNYYQNDCACGAVVKGARISSAFPATINVNDTTDNRHIVTNLTYDAPFPNPSIISDSIAITAKESLNLFYVEDSLVEHKTDGIVPISFYDDHSLDSNQLFTNVIPLNTTGDIYHTDTETHYVQYAIHTQSTMTPDNDLALHP